jgi:hypothetical protein
MATTLRHGCPHGIVCLKHQPSAPEAGRVDAQPRQKPAHGTPEGRGGAGLVARGQPYHVCITWIVAEQRVHREVCLAASVEAVALLAR